MNGASHTPDCLEPTVEADIDVAMRSLLDPRVTGIWQDRVVAALARIGEPALPALIEALRGRNPLVAARAARVLKQSPLPAAREVLRRHVRDGFATQRARRWRRHLRSAGSTLTVFAACLWTACNLLWLQNHVVDPAHLSFVAAGFACLAYLLAKSLGNPAVDARRVAVSALADARDLHDVDLLARCLYDDQPAIRSEAAFALNQMLRGLRASDAGLLSDAAMQAFIRELGCRNTGVILAILAAMEQVGDERALPAVERLAAGQGAGRKAEVRRAAEACLPALRERVERSQSTQGLLRPVEATGKDPSALLRPASATETDAQALVRPAGKGECV